MLIWGLANLDVLMGVTAPYNITHLISGQKTLKEIILKCPGGVFLIPGGSGIVSALIDERKLRVLLESLPVLDEYFDYLIIDTGAGINKQVLSFALAAEEVVVVTTPDPTSLADAFNIIKVIHRGECRSTYWRGGKPSRQHQAWRRGFLEASQSQQEFSRKGSIFNRNHSF